MLVVGLGCDVLMGLVVGALTGIVLLALLPDPTRTEPPSSADQSLALRMH